MNDPARSETEPVGRFDYSSTFGLEYHETRSVPERAEEWLSAARAEKLQSFISPGDRVCEYGVGFGWNLAQLHCAEKIGFDRLSTLAKSVEKKGIRFIGNENQIPVGYFDVVLAHHVLEHVPKPVEALRFLKSLVRRGGKLLLFVPFEREARYKRWRYERAHHVYSWTPEALRRTAEESGWRVEVVRISRFRFDRLAAVLTFKAKGNYGLYVLLRRLGTKLLPEYEIFLVGS